MSREEKTANPFLRHPSMTVVAVETCRNEYELTSFFSVLSVQNNSECLYMKDSRGWKKNEIRRHKWRKNSKLQNIKNELLWYCLCVFFFSFVSLLFCTQTCCWSCLFCFFWTLPRRVDLSEIIKFLLLLRLFVCYGYLLWSEQCQTSVHCKTTKTMYVRTCTKLCGNR